MRNINRFVIDFLGYFILLVGSVLIAIAEIITQIVYSLQKLWHSVLVPMFLESMVFLHWFGLIAYQAILCVTSDWSLYLSKKLLQLSKLSHEQSEQLINKTWNWD